MKRIKDSKQQVSVRVSKELLKLLKQRYSYLDSDSEVIRAAMLIAYEVGRQ
jgi:hypothetical protein